MYRGNPGEQLPDQDVVVFVILDKEDPYGGVLHVTLLFAVDSSAALHGSSTISNQYLPSDFITSHSPSNVTGFVMYEFAPRL